MVVHVDNFSIQNDVAREKILLSEAVLGKFLICSSVVKCSIFGNFQIFLKISVFFAAEHLVIHFLGTISSFDQISAKCYDDDYVP